MQPHVHDPMNCTAARLERIAALHLAHARELERRVARRAHTAPQDNRRWLLARLGALTRPHVDVAQPSRQVLAWLAQTAMREVWRSERRRLRDELVDPAALECAAAASHERSARRSSSG